MYLVICSLTQNKPSFKTLGYKHIVSILMSTTSCDFKNSYITNYRSNHVKNLIIGGKEV